MLDRFAAFAEEYRSTEPDPAVTLAATRAVIDWTAATMAGAVMEPARILVDALVDEDEIGHARLVLDGSRVRPRTAALINATASHTAEMDDIYRDGIYHPGSPTVGAALAMAQHLDASGAALLRAVTVGYEVGDRIAAAVQPEHYKFWHTTGTVGTIGAAAAVAELLELDAERFLHALATATTMAAGLQQAFRSDAMSKPLHAGHAAEAGMLASMAAARGFTGARDVLDGAAGFAVAMAGGADLTSAGEALGSDLCITRPTVKYHSCCGHTFAAVDAALLLRDRGIRPADVDRINIYTYAIATTVAGNPDPKTAFEAKFSIQYCVAAALTLGAVRLRAFEQEALGDPTIRDLVARTAVTVDDVLDAGYPQARGARVRVVLRDGSTIEELRTTRKGDPDDPLTDDELRAKFDELVEPVLGISASAVLSKELWGIADLPGVRDLTLTPGSAMTASS